MVAFLYLMQKNVMTYSSGDGSLYKADGEPYAKGKKLESSNMTESDVKVRLEAATSSQMTST